jgi:hypothetical protein
MTGGKRRDARAVLADGSSGYVRGQKRAPSVSSGRSPANSSGDRSDCPTIEPAIAPMLSAPSWSPRSRMEIGDALITRFARKSGVN